MKIYITVDAIRCTYCNGNNTPFEASSSAEWNNRHIAVIAELGAGADLLSRLWKHNYIRRLVSDTRRTVQHKTFDILHTRFQTCKRCENA